MDPQDDRDDSSSDDDAASQTTEDDPQVPEHQEASAHPVAPPPIVNPASRERPHYQLRHTLKGHTMSISAVKFSPDGTLLASSGSFIQLFPGRQKIFELGTLHLAGYEKAVKIWSPATGKLIRNLAGHTQGLSDVAWSTDSVYLASASDDTTIRIWEVDKVCYNSVGVSKYTLIRSREGIDTQNS